MWNPISCEVFSTKVVQNLFIKNISQERKFKTKLTAYLWTVKPTTFHRMFDEYPPPDSVRWGLLPPPFVERNLWTIPNMHCTNLQLNRSNYPNRILKYIFYLKSRPQNLNFLYHIRIINPPSLESHLSILDVHFSSKSLFSSKSHRCIIKSFVLNQNLNPFLYIKTPSFWYQNPTLLIPKMLWGLSLNEKILQSLLSWSKLTFLSFGNEF